MENIENKSIFGLDIDDEGSSHLSAIARWANINAITAFIALGLSLISTIVTLNKVSSYYGSGRSTVTISTILGLFIGLVISLALNITLITAASNIKKGVEQTNQSLFGIGLTKLATYFKILGILIIVGLVIVALLLLVVLLAGANGGFM